MADNSNHNHLTAELRTSFGKGAARKIRALNKIPAVIYGHGTDPQHVTLPGHEVALIIRKSNQVLELDIEGRSQLALVKDVQKDPVRQIIEHLDLIVVRKGEKVHVDVYVRVIGEPVPESVVLQDASSVLVEVEATNIPEFFEVNVEGAEIGTSIYAKDIVLPAGASLLSDPELLILNVSVPEEIDLGELPVVEAVEEEVVEEAPAE
jgi:large subunit ribosomal protein L25